MINPLRLEIPELMITKRLQLRCPRVGDGAVIIETVLASLKELKEWMPWASDQYDVKDAEDWCRRATARFALREEASYLIFNRETSRYMGNISAFSQGWSVPKFEVGYWLASDQVGHGYMTEAVQAVTAMTFQAYQARRIEIHTDERNQRSRRVAERAGYALEGILRNECRDRDEQLRATCIYAMTK